MLLPALVESMPQLKKWKDKITRKTCKTWNVLKTQNTKWSKTSKTKNPQKWNPKNEGIHILETKNTRLIVMIQKIDLYRETQKAQTLERQ